MNDSRTVLKHMIYSLPGSVSEHHTQPSALHILFFLCMYFPRIPKYNFYLIVISFATPELKLYHSLLILSKNIVSTTPYTRKLPGQEIFLGESTMYLHAGITGEEVLFCDVKLIVYFG